MQIPFGVVLFNVKSSDAKWILMNFLPNLPNFSRLEMSL